jgi:hypothetical protein
MSEKEFGPDNIIENDRQLRSIADVSGTHMQHSGVIMDKIMGYTILLILISE